MGIGGSKGTLGSFHVWNWFIRRFLNKFIRSFMGIGGSKGTLGSFLEKTEAEPSCVNEIGW